MTDVIPDEIQPDGSEIRDPASNATTASSAADNSDSSAATLESSPSDAADPATPPVSDATTTTSTSTTEVTPEAAPVAAASEPEAIAAPAAATASEAGPSLEASTSVPASGEAVAAGAEGGGEWELLLGKLQAWLGSGELQALWSQARRPLNLLLAVVGLVLVLRVYSGLIGAIDSLPLVPGLLELVGLIWAVRCGLPRLIQSSAREQLISGLLQRWHSFTGRG